jgi:hypothetical protein
MMAGRLRQPALQAGKAEAALPAVAAPLWAQVEKRAEGVANSAYV